MQIYKETKQKQQRKRRFFPTISSQEGAITELLAMYELAECRLAMEIEKNRQMQELKDRIERLQEERFVLKEEVNRVKRCA